MPAQKASRPVADFTADGPREDDLTGRQIDSVAIPKTIFSQATTIRIVITPTRSGRKWRASVDGEKLCVSASPLITSARLLIAKDFDPTRIVEMRHLRANAWSLRGQLGKVAATLLDGEKITRPAKNGVPIRFPEMAATSLAGVTP